MKKQFACLLCGIMVLSFIFCGCNQATETSAANTTESQTEATTTVAETEPAPTEHHPEISSDNMKKVADLYASKCPDGKDAVPVYADGIRGNAVYYYSNGTLYFEYVTDSGVSTIRTGIQAGKVTADVSYNLIYKDKGAHGEGNTGIETFERFFDDVIADTAPYVTVLDRTAVIDCPEEFKKDLPIYYSRFITLADNAFPELGLKLEDLGVNLGTKYRMVDPKQAASTEVSVTDTHKFVNGFCTDCNKSWTAICYDAVGKMSGTTKKGWRSFYGRPSATMLSYGDQVQYSTLDKKCATLMYSKAADNEKDEGELFYISVTDTSTKKKKSLNVEMEYRLLMKPVFVGKDVNGYKYIYSMTIKAKPDQYDEVFASKESLMKYATFELFIVSKKGAWVNAWGKKANIAKLKKDFEKDGCQYYSKEQIVDKLWEHHENFLASLDSGMEYMGLSLSDIGVDWKKTA